VNKKDAGCRRTKARPLPGEPDAAHWDEILVPDPCGEIRIRSEMLARMGLDPGAGIVLRRTQEGLLLRSAAQPLTKVYLEPTTDCNLRCRTCMRSSWSEPGGSMDLGLVRKVLEDLGRLPRMPELSFWGFGEPLLHPDILEMIRLAKQAGARTELVTNGLLLNRSAADRLLALGLDKLVVSIDGVSPESHAQTRTGADLEAVKKNVTYLNAARLFAGLERPEIGIEFVLMRRNLSDLPNLPELARSLGASFVIVTNVLPYTEELKDEILYGMSAAEWPRSARRFGDSPEVRLPRLDIREGTREALTGFLVNAGSFGAPSAAPADLEAWCPFVWEGKTAIAWNGDVAPCVALLHSYTSFVLGRQKSIRRWAVGNVGREDLIEIWNKPEYREFRRRLASFDFAPCIHCDCEMAEANEEDCFGSPFPTCGDCLWARGVILCP